MKSTLWVKRVVLVDGKPSGKGRPNKSVKASRTCLYIPLKETFETRTKASSERPYNPAKNADQRKQFKRTNLASLKPVQPLAPAAPVAVNETPATAPAETPAVA